MTLRELIEQLGDVEGVNEDKKVLIFHTGGSWYFDLDAIRACEPADEEGEEGTLVLCVSG